MMDYLNFLTPTIESLGGFGYWLVFLIAFCESFAFVGTLIPGSILIYLVGFLSARGYFDIITLIWFTTAGAILGDGSSYLLGTKGKDFFKNENKLLKLSHLEKGEEFFRKHGPKSVFLGRFIGPLRPIIPFIAGLSRMDRKTFFLWNISSAFLWSVSHLLVGYFFGGAIDVIEAWTTRAGIIIASSAAVLGILWIILKKGGPFFAFLKSFYFSTKDRFVSSRFFENFADNNPALTNFITGRFSNAHFSGLPLTLVSVGFVYVLFLLFGSVQNALSSETITLSDKRIADLLFSFRDLQIVEFFTWFTLLAKWQIIVALAIAVTLILHLWRKEFYIPALWATIIAGELFNYLGGIAFYRERPEYSFYLKSDSSFPSGNSVMAMAFYGFIVYLLLRHSETWGRKTNVIFLGIVAIIGVGFGSLYLGESFWSDVWGGYLLGLLCLMIGISFAELLKSHEKTEDIIPALNARSFSVIILAAWLVFYAGFSMRYNPALSAATETQTANLIKISSALDIFDGGKMPKFSEQLFGVQSQQINFIIIAESKEELVSTMNKTGWVLADQSSFGTILTLLRAEILREDYPTSPMTPSFWNAKVNDLGFEKPSSGDIYSRRHFRVWSTPFETPQGKVYAGTIRLDTVKWIFVHKSSPYVDIERELLFSDLSAAGVVAESKKIQLTGPIVAGEDLSKTSFVTDGGLYEVVLKR